MSISKRGVTMDNVNKTLYIPLYGKSYVSKKGIFINDKKAEDIWEKEKFKLKGKSKSKYLAYYMAIRASVFDAWVRDKINEQEDAVILHIGCGMDSRVIRTGIINHKWYDVDFPEVISERKKYYQENDYYKMICGDARKLDWLTDIPNARKAIVILEGISMYLTNSELKGLITSLDNRFEKVSLLMDCYSKFAAKMSKYKNPINDVGVTKVYGVDEPATLESNNLKFIQHHVMIPKAYYKRIRGFEGFIFKRLYAGGLSRRLYKLFEYKK